MLLDNIQTKAGKFFHALPVKHFRWHDLDILQRAPVEVH